MSLLRRTAAVLTAMALTATTLLGAAAPASASTAAAGKKYAEQQARAFGVTVTWHADGKVPCGNGRQAGCFSGYTNRISLNAAIQKHPNRYIRYVVAHEAAHYHVVRTCGTMRPPIVGNRFEQVTDAYTHGVLGVPLPERNVGAYGYTKDDLARAKKIAAGTCAANQKAVAVKQAGHTFHGITSGSYKVPRGARLQVVSTDHPVYPRVRDAQGRVGRVQVAAWS
ncbi:hypothetical protein DNL40_05950 [Xylanimonas oleitrophica]|uniref:Metalloprotease n=1 Tax=Xylanimonas oleitrophica TaxID=2607479 RepID=A0A2W5X0B1_9MICO|nr:DUF45 domain-containing protein [Xylanimonas oleitrophica]PZR53675.1 hypothetical protein DNL40_05950 [Xylanimonas oleitrophica]